jgi:hypothetical protein
VKYISTNFRRTERGGRGVVISILERGEVGEGMFRGGGVGGCAGGGSRIDGGRVC